MDRLAAASPRCLALLLTSLHARQLLSSTETRDESHPAVVPVSTGNSPSGDGAPRTRNAPSALVDRVWSAPGPRVVRETTKTAARRCGLMKGENYCATTDIDEDCIRARDTQNTLIFPYKEEAGGSSPSTPTMLFAALVRQRSFLQELLWRWRFRTRRLRGGCRYSARDRLWVKPESVVHRG